jgi:hypothetical protein
MLLELSLLRTEHTSDLQCFRGFTISTEAHANHDRRSFKRFGVIDDIYQRDSVGRFNFSIDRGHCELL